MIDDENLPLITVGITSHNRPITLSQILTSVIDQTYKNLEVFIADDSSTDPQVKKVINHFESLDKRVRSLHVPGKSSFIENVNLIFKESKGKYVMRLDDDDWIDKDYIEKCFNFMKDNESYVLVTGATKFYFEEKYVYDGKNINIDEDDSLKRILSFHIESLGSGNCPNFGLIKKDQIKNLYFKNILGHDNIFLANIAYIGKIKTIENTYIHRRLGGSSETLSKVASVFHCSFIEIYCPYIALLFNMLNDILFTSSCLKKLSFHKKLFFSFQLILMLIYNVGAFFSIYKKRFTSQYKNNIQYSNIKAKSYSENSIV